jgi:hypothetical protein
MVLLFLAVPQHRPKTWSTIGLRSKARCCTSGRTWSLFGSGLLATRSTRLSVFGGTIIWRSMENLQRRSTMHSTCMTPSRKLTTAKIPGILSKFFTRVKTTTNPVLHCGKNATYKVYTQDTHEVLVLQLASTDFDGHYNYTAHKDTEQQPDGLWTPKYSNLMSGDWAWNKLVCIHYVLSIPHQQLTIQCRMSLLRTHK